MKKEIRTDIGNTQTVTDCNICKITKLGVNSVGEAINTLIARQLADGCANELTRCASLANLIEGTATIDPLSDSMKKVTDLVKKNNFEELSPL